VVEANDKVDRNRRSLSDDDDNDEATSTSEAPGGPSTTVQSVCNVLCLAAALIGLGERFGGSTAALPVTTLLTVLLAATGPRLGRWTTPLQPTAACLGTVGLYVFFATAGAPGMAVAESVRASLLPLSLFLTTLYSVHGLILALCHKLVGSNMRMGGAFLAQRLLVASSAAIGGPATAVALAQAANWKSLIVPSLLVGNIGYAIATFSGLAYYAVFR